VSEGKELKKTQKIFRDVMYKALIEIVAEKYLEIFKIYRILMSGVRD
jgi:hypothetical protein